MNIIYFTSSITNSDFTSFMKIWDKPINPSNQLFHNKLIRTLGVNNKVDVISIRPFSKSICNTKKLLKEEKVFGNISWHYLKVTSSKPIKYFSCLLQTHNVKFDKDSIVVTDTINPGILSIAKSFARKHKLKIIGVCTDSPSNITNTKRSYTLACLKIARTLDGYITLTNELNELFNPNSKPSFNIEGIVENESPNKTKSKYGKYIFFVGSLLLKYGISNLIEAYESMENFPYKLVIAGHSHNEYIKDRTKNNPNIIFLDSITNEDALELEANSWVNINPRPYSEDLDRYCIPSKVLEYFNAKVPVISTRSTKLQKVFNSNAVWINNNSTAEIVKAFQKVTNLSQEKYDQMALSAHEKVQHYYSINSISPNIDDFLSLFRKDRN